MPFVAQILLLLAVQRGIPKFEAGLALYASGDCARANSAFIESEQANEDAPLRNLYKGVCLARLNAWEQAAGLLAPYAASHAGEALAWSWLARADLHRKHFPEAREAVLKAMALKKNSADIYRLLGEIELELRNPQAAYDAWTEAHRLDSRDGQTTFYLGRLFFEAGLVDEAADWFRQTLTLSPRQFRAMTYLGLCSERLGAKEAATQLYTAAMGESTRQQKPYSWAFLDLAKLLRESGRDKEAMDVLRKAEKLCPEAHVFALMGQMLAASEPEQAQDALRRAIALDPGIPDAHYRLSLLLRASGNLPEAQAEIEEFQRTKEISDRNTVKVTVFEKVPK